MNDDIPEVPVKTTRKSLWERLSIVWIVPFGALLIAVAVAFNAWQDQGPLIEISFEDASGIKKDETELRYRNVAVGIVENVKFSSDLSRVIASVRIDNDVAEFVDEESSFWVIQPEVTTSGVSGLDTVLSGVYIEGSWDTTAGGLHTQFEGLDDPPLAAAGQDGFRFELRTSRDSGLTENTPIIFKGIEVGRIGAARISQDGRWIFADAIVFEPHDRLVTTATRFWDTSGFSFSLGPSGATVNFSSVASLISGGITFDTLVSGGQIPQDGTVFEVYPDEAAARSSVFEASDGTTITLSVIFEENISGLAAESPVEWRGVRIGEVANVTGIVDLDRFGDERVRLLATLELTPSRFGLTGELSEEEALDFLAERVDEGLRARLVSASILTGGLKVEFLTVEDAVPLPLDRDNDPFPLMPVTDSEVADVSATAEGVFERINALPIEDLLNSAIGFLDNATAFVTSEDIRETPGELRGLLSEARGVIGSEDIQALPGEVSAVMSDLQGAVTDLRGILQAFSDADAVDRLLAAVDQAGAAAETAQTSFAAVPDLIADINAFVDTANTLPLEDLLAQATGLAEDARGVIGSEAARGLPARLNDTIAELETILAGLAESNAAGQLTDALAAAETAAQSVETAVAGVPQVVERIDNIAASAERVALDELATELSELLDTADRLFGDASEAQLPDALAGALNEAELALAELREGGLIENANETLAATERAAAAVAEAAEDLPAVVGRIDAALAQARSTLANFDDRSTFSREAMAALREVQKAADAVEGLARTLERRPNSILLGR